MLGLMEVVMICLSGVKMLLISAKIRKVETKKRGRLSINGYTVANRYCYQIQKKGCKICFLEPEKNQDARA